MKKILLLMTAAFLLGSHPIQAQQQAEEFTVATLNVDGLPDELMGVSINPDGPGEKYTPEMAEYLLKKDYDFVGLQENYNYYDLLFPKLEATYQHDNCRGKILVKNFAYPYPNDGVNLIWRNGIQGGRTDSVRWRKSYGLLDHAFDDLLAKGFRRYDLTLPGGARVVVYNGHWDASVDSDEIKGKDGRDRQARLVQWMQLRDVIMRQLDDRPVIILGDTWSYYCRDSVKTHFIDYIQATGRATVADAWVELERKGEYPHMVEGPVTRDPNGHGHVRQGEMLDKILYINPTHGSKLIPLSYSVDSLTFMRSDDPAAPLSDRFPVAVKFRIEPAEETPQTSPARWMEQLDDSRMVTDLSLPGTHDAATAEGWTGLATIIGDAAAKAQDLTIEEQWNIGVRVFDIRPQKDGDVLRCMHGISGTKLLVGDFFAKMRDLLAASPTEFAIVATKIDTSKGEPEVPVWAPLFRSIIYSDSLRQCFAEFSPTMTVGDLRGKILLLSRNQYDEQPLGGFITGWSSDKDFANQQGGTITGSNGNTCPLWMQDYYEPNKDREGKDNAIRLMLDAAMNRDLTTQQPAWVMNYTAGNTQSFLSDGYRENAVYAHQVVLDYLSDETHTASTGIVFMDFAGVDQSVGSSGTAYDVKGLKLVQALIAQNFRQGTTPTAISDLSGHAPKHAPDQGWFTLGGARLSAKPSAPGIYLHQGRKIIVR